MLIADINISDSRQPEQKINPLMLKRWSPRAFSGESLTDEEIIPLFEAAKWAPSAFNSQPWRFIYAKNGTSVWNKLFSALGEFNQVWASKASVLILVITQNNFEHNNKPNFTASFDAGAACENLALEAVSRGLFAHAMSGFDYDQARTNLNIPLDYKLEVMIAIGRSGKKENLPEKMQSAEIPSGRKKLIEIISEGEFKF
ncbi:MAG: nitroreductase family protein [Patescibacteria group bacterium]|jgi:nitroreductase